MSENRMLSKHHSAVYDFFAAMFKTKKIVAVGMSILLMFVLMALFADLIAPQKAVNGVLKSNLLQVSRPPSAAHWLGTDATGVDLLSYIIYGARTSVILGFSCTILATIISVIIGVATAVIGGTFDLVVQRIVDSWLCVPGMLILLILMSIFGSGMIQMILVMSVPAGIGGSRIMRSAAFAVKDSGYSTMSRTLGGSYLWRMWKHVVPNIMPFILMNLANSLGGVIMMEATLNFLGFGVKIGTPSWGYLLTSQGRTKMFTAPWIGLAPGMAITIMVFAAAIFGDGVRDLLDPRLKGGVGSFSKRRIKGITAKYAKRIEAEGKTGV
jgi:peptide/nickel transport system permease protein